jgi:hypothetical protein
MIWKVPEIIAELSKLFIARSRRYRHDRHAGRRRRRQRGDRVDCGIDGVATLSSTSPDGGKTMPIYALGGLKPRLPPPAPTGLPRMPT